MKETELGQWVEASEEARKLFTKEALLLDVTEAIWEAMEKRGLNKVQLADALGTSKSNITQLLDGTRNMTLGTLSDLAFVLGLRVNVRLCDKSEMVSWEHVEAVLTKGTRMAFQPIEVANDKWFELRAA